jgi:hypothetical protein
VFPRDSDLPAVAQVPNQIPSRRELALFAPFVVGATRRNGLLRPRQST